MLGPSGRLNYAENYSILEARGSQASCLSGEAWRSGEGEFNEIAQSIREGQVVAADLQALLFGMAFLVTERFPGANYPTKLFG